MIRHGKTQDVLERRLFGQLPSTSAQELTSKYDPETTALLFAVGKKDMMENPRFKIGLKKNGEPSYFQDYEANKDNLQPFTQHGYLVHVDFGYVLGDDPKHVATPMRITEDMVDALGGKNSRTFELFVQRTQEGYELMRLHADLWYHLLCTPFYVFNDTEKKPKRIKDHILDRFVPGEWSSEASLHIQTVVQQASETSYLQNLLDMSHTASNQLSDLFRMRNFFK